jgi:hypothetical protein
MPDIKIDGIAVISDADGNLTIVECERVPLSADEAAPDPKLVEEARKKLNDANSSDAA